MNNMLEKNVRLDNQIIFVTGAAGFIGANLTLELLKNVENVHVIGMMYPSRSIA